MFAEPSGKALVPCGKANIGGEINGTANLTQGLQIRQLGAVKRRARERAVDLASDRRLTRAVAVPILIKAENFCAPAPPAARNG